MSQNNSWNPYKEQLRQNEFYMFTGFEDKFCAGFLSLEDAEQFVSFSGEIKYIGKNKFLLEKKFNKDNYHIVDNGEGIAEAIFGFTKDEKEQL